MRSAPDRLLHIRCVPVSFFAEQSFVFELAIQRTVKPINRVRPLKPVFAAKADGGFDFPLLNTKYESRTLPSLHANTSVLSEMFLTTSFCECVCISVSKALANERASGRFCVCARKKTSFQ